MKREEKTEKNRWGEGEQNRAESDTVDKKVKKKFTDTEPATKELESCSRAAQQPRCRGTQ